MSGIDSAILDALETTLKTLPWVKKVNTEEIILGFSETEQHEVPLIQVYGLGQRIEMERSRIKTYWTIVVELVLRSSYSNSVNMRTLLDYRQEIEQVIGGNANLGVPGVIHVAYTGNSDDIRLAKPFYVTELEFEVQYYKPYTGFC
jgi:hypothetical protein